MYISLRMVNEHDIKIKQDNDPKHTSRCRQTVIQSKLVPSRPTIVFNDFWKNLP